MGTNRTLNKKPMTRPKKKASERKRREKTQRQRLIALGMSEEAVGKLNAKEVRTRLMRPQQVSAAER